MGQATGRVVSLGLAVSSLPIIAVVLTLAAPRDSVNGPAFLAGSIEGLVAVGTIGLLASSGANAERSRSVDDTGEHPRDTPRAQRGRSVPVWLRMGDAGTRDTTRRTGWRRPRSVSPAGGCGRVSIVIVALSYGRLCA
jgi:hypothetical protein